MCCEQMRTDAQVCQPAHRPTALDLLPLLLLPLLIMMMISDAALMGVPCLQVGGCLGAQPPVVLMLLRRRNC
jgi:hypothetical protein